MSKPAKGRVGASERARLQAIRSVDLDAARPTFERIARIAQRLSGAPTVYVSLVEADHLWLAGVSNRPAPRVARKHALANISVETGEMLWVEDASTDPRFADNPHVHGGISVRGYAAAPIRLSNGSVVGALSVIDQHPRAYDATLNAQLQDLAALAADEWERRRALRDAARGEARTLAANKVLAAIVQNAPVALVMTNRRMRVLHASPKFRQDMGLGEGPLVGRNFYDLFPKVRERWGRAYDRALKGETMRIERTRATLPDGRQRWLHVELCPWRDHRDRVGGLLIMGHDVTEMVEALERSTRSEQTLKLALEIGELHVWELDHRRRELNTVGRQTVETAGVMDYDRMANDIWSAVHPHDRDQAMQQWLKHEEDGSPYRATFRMMRHDGPHVWVQSATEAVRGKDGSIERVVGLLRNIDKQKRAEIALAKARDAAESANRAKSEFLANMSHEIRTPLNGVMGVASALGRTQLDAGQREMVGIIESSAQTLESLLSDVLDLARIEAGRLVLEHEPFNLRRAVSDVAALFEPSARAKGLDFVVEAAPDLDGVFLGDASRIRQILSNLLSNAIKFTPAGAVRVVATALRNPEGVEACVTVSDTGIGFDEETKARLFDRFEQADGSITRRYGGTGLGLAISRSLAARMGGEISAESAPGQGASFRFTTPLIRAPAALAEEAKALGGDAPTPSVGSLKVLLAEDHPTNRRVVELILGAAGVDLTSVENGALAVEAWESGAFDLVFMDMQMPVMDGLTAIAEIRAREVAQGRSRTQIYSLTANAMPEHAKASHEAGADGHLTKPITADALFRAVDDAAERTRAAGPSAVPQRAQATATKPQSG